MALEKKSYNKNLKLLWWLRNIAIIGQVAAILYATNSLHIPLPENKLYMVISLLAAANAFTLLRLTYKKPVNEHEFFAQLLVDTLALGGVLYFSGGASNPFSTLFLLQIIIAATTLPPRFTWALSVITLGIYTLLVFYKVNMEYIYHHHIGQFFNIHLHGMWISFVLLVILISWFVVRINITISRQNELLGQSEKIASMGALAAIAAHELGTPLATISLLASELEETAKSDEEKQNAQIMREQIARCKRIISEISLRAGSMKADSGKVTSLQNFLEEIAENWKKEKPSVNFTYEITCKNNQEVLADYGFVQAIYNLLNNAADASTDYVSMRSETSAETLKIYIEDKGKGFSEEQLKILGEPLTSTKEQGLGIGIYLSQIVISRLGGKLDISNSSTGAIAKITIPLSSLKI